MPRAWHALPSAFRLLQEESQQLPSLSLDAKEEALVLGKVCGRSRVFLLTSNVYGRLVCLPGSPFFCRLCTVHLCTCLCLYPYLYPSRVLCLFLCRGLVRRRTSIWEAFDCAWSAMGTAEKSGETVLPSYVVCPANTTYRALPFCTEGGMRRREKRLR